MPNRMTGKFWWSPRYRHPWIYNDRRDEPIEESGTPKILSELPFQRMRPLKLRNSSVFCQDADRQGEGKSWMLPVHHDVEDGSLHTLRTGYTDTG
jgi:hypothetical protein